MKSGFKFGAGKTVIPLGLGGPLAGYAAREGCAAGVHDPLFARMALFDGNDRQYALLVLDLLKVDRNLVTRISEAVNAVTGIPRDAITVAATHTHSGPAGVWENYDNFNPELGNSLVQSISDLAGKVWGDRVPAKLGMQNGVLHELGRNRNNSDIPYDPMVGVIRVDRLDGQTLAIIFNYACHPTVLGETNLLFSRDFPGYAVDLIERGIPGNQPVAIFVNGAAGDISTRYTRKASTFAEAERLGGLLAERVLTINRNLVTSQAWEIESKRTTVALPRRRISLESSRKILLEASQKLTALQAQPGVSPGALRTAQTTVQAAEIMLNRLVKKDQALKETDRNPPVTPQESLAAEVEAVCFTGAIQAALVVLPGEIVAAIGKRIKETIHNRNGMGFEHIWIIGYGNGHIGYLCPAEIDQKTDYEAIMSEVDAAATELIIEAVCDLVLKGS